MITAKLKKRYYVYKHIRNDTCSIFYIGVKDFQRSETRLSLLKVNDKTVAMVVENRTEFNHCEYVFCEESISSQRVVELEGALRDILALTASENNPYPFKDIASKALNK